MFKITNDFFKFRPYQWSNRIKWNNKHNILRILLLLIHQINSIIGKVLNILSEELEFRSLKSKTKQLLTTFPFILLRYQISILSKSSNSSSVACVSASRTWSQARTDGCAVHVAEWNCCCRHCCSICSSPRWFDVACCCCCCCCLLAVYYYCFCCASMIRFHWMLLPCWRFHRCIVVACWSQQCLWSNE